MPNDDAVGTGGWGVENVCNSDDVILVCSLRLTVGYLKATVVHIKVTLGHLRVTKGYFFYKKT